jgi:DNA-binding XRE family transcriptional regulator
VAGFLLRYIERQQGKTMTPDELIQWRTSVALSKRKAAEALGLARNTFRAYESGKQPIPRYIELAVTALFRTQIAALEKDSHADL